MAHFAILSEGGFVTEVVRLEDSVIRGSDGMENEDLGREFLSNLLGVQKELIVQTSYNKTFRYNYAGIGMIYDKNKNAFLFPKPYNSWKLNEATMEWLPPTPAPPDGNRYIWDEGDLRWVPIGEPDNGDILLVL